MTEVTRGKSLTTTTTTITICGRLIVYFAFPQTKKISLGRYYNPIMKTQLIIDNERPRVRQRQRDKLLLWKCFGKWMMKIRKNHLFKVLEGMSFIFYLYI